MTFFNSPPILAALANMNRLCVLCKRLAGIKDCEIVRKSIFEGYPRRAEVWEGCVKFF